MSRESPPLNLTASEHDPVAPPTHRLEGIKIGDYGVQLLISTKDHLYDAKDVEAGEHAFQAIGAWEESSVQELSKLISQREVPRQQNNESIANRTFMGSGKKLGSAAERTRQD
ncbi:hypothetical protein LIA77_09135 [Sarocladium implicatum]|nr:hypothetical protein LIA77_09135 [Sarocladium implicatum]